MNNNKIIALFVLMVSLSASVGIFASDLRSVATLASLVDSERLNALAPVNPVASLFDVNSLSTLASLVDSERLNCLSCGIQYPSVPKYKRQSSDVSSLTEFSVAEVMSKKQKNNGSENQVLNSIPRQKRSSSAVSDL